MIKIYNYGLENPKKWEFFYNEEHHRINLGLQDRSYIVKSNKIYSPYLSKMEDIDVGFTTIKRVGQDFMLNTGEKQYDNSEDLMFVSFALKNFDTINVKLYESLVLYRNTYKQGDFNVHVFIVKLFHPLGFMRIYDENGINFMYSLDESAECVYKTSKKYRKCFSRLYTNNKIDKTTEGALLEGCLIKRNKIINKITSQVEKGLSEKFLFITELKKVIAEVVKNKGEVDIVYGYNSVEVFDKKYLYLLENIDNIKLRLLHMVKYSEHV